MTGIRLCPDEKRRIREWWAKGMYQAEIARRLNRCEETIRRLLRADERRKLERDRNIPVEHGASCDQCGQPASPSYPLKCGSDNWLRCPRCAAKVPEKYGLTRHIPDSGAEHLELALDAGDEKRRAEVEEGWDDKRRAAAVATAPMPADPVKRYKMSRAARGALIKRKDYVASTTDDK